MSDDTSTPDVMRAVRSSFAFSVAMVLLGVFFIVFDRNGTRAIGYFVAVVAGSLAVAAVVAILNVRRRR